MIVPEIIDRIMGTGICPAEINDHNSTRIISHAQDGGHDPDNCNRKDCIHGMRDIDIDWAATIASESQFICTCGQHGVDNPAEAARVVKEFRDRWT